VAEQKRWTNRPRGSTWGDWGIDDQRGRLNMLTTETTLRGVRTVTAGKTFSLSMPLDYPKVSLLNAARRPPVIRPTQRTDTIVNYNVDLGALDPGRTDVLSDDLAVIYLQYSTQWDSFAHAGSQFDVDGNGTRVPVYYNGYRAGTDIVGTRDVAESGLRQGAVVEETAHAHALGNENMAETGVQGRAVLVDLAAHYGLQRQVIGFEQWRHVLEVDDIVIEPGDMVLVHTGFVEYIMESGGDPDPEELARRGCVLDGTDQQLLQWITDSGVVAIAADNYAVENYPGVRSEHSASILPLHEHCLFKLGVHLGELWRLSPLAQWLRENNRTSFLLTAPPLMLSGAVGSPVTPVATV
jgi:kynurenine formamidase